jgi:hypothetical protein
MNIGLIIELDNLPHIARRHQTNGELTIFRAFRSGDLRWIEVGGIVFLNGNTRGNDRFIAQCAFDTYVEDFSFRHALELRLRLVSRSVEIRTTQLRKKTITTIIVMRRSNPVEAPD